LKVSNPNESRAMVLEALDGTAGTPREIVTLNAGVALYASGAAGSIDEGIRRAREAIASGAARNKLDQFVGTTRKLAAA
jgi:anthranilate phosphoribosyltransferase